MKIDSLFLTLWLFLLSPLFVKPALGNEQIRGIESATKKGLAKCGSDAQCQRQILQLNKEAYRCTEENRVGSVPYQKCLVRKGLQAQCNGDTQCLRALDFAFYPCFDIHAAPYFQSAKLGQVSQSRKRNFEARFRGCMKRMGFSQIK